MEKENKKNIWNNLDSVLFVINFNNIDDISEYKKAIKLVNLNIHNCIILAIVKTKKEKSLIPKQYNVVFISDQEFNFFGIIKNEEVRNISSRSYDMLLFTTDVSKKILKLLKKTNKKMSVGINTNFSGHDITLKIETDLPSKLINFTKETLEKILYYG